MKRNAVLIEVIISILVFSLVSALALLMISRSAETQKESRAGTLAVMTAQNEIERLKSDKEELAALFLAGGETLYYDGDFRPVSEKNAERLMLVSVKQHEAEAGVLYELRISIKETGGKRIADFETAVYSGEAGA